MLRLSRSAFSIYAITLAAFAVLGVAAIPVAGSVLRSGHGFLPGGQALAWDGPLVVLHVSADLLIGVAYVVISLALVRLARSTRGTIPFIWAFVAFGLFIVACGMTHMASALTVWEPMWWVAGGIKYITAAVSVAMAVAAPPLMPRVIDAATEARETERMRRERAEAAQAAAEREAATLATLNRTARLLAAELDTGRLVQAVADAGVELTGATYGVFQAPATGPGGTTAVAGTPPPLRSPGTGEVATDDTATDRAPSDSAAAGGQRTRAGAEASRLVVPVVSRSGKALGELSFGHPEPGVFGEREEDLAKGLAAHAAVALDNARLFAEARAGEEQLRAAFESASGGMALVGLDGRWLRVNHALCAMLGYEEAELLRLTFQDVTHPDDLEADLAQVEQLLAEAIATYQMEKRYLRRDGTIVWVLLSVGLVHDDVGAPLHFVAQIQDITERKRVELERERMAAIVESAADAIIGRNLDGTITSWNVGAERLFGYTQEEAVGRPITMLSPPEQAGEIDRFLDAVRRGERIEIPEAVRVAKDGRHRHVSVTVSPVRDAAGRVLGASTIARDVSERRRLEELRRDFLAMVTHDLRTPLTTVRGQTQLLQMRGEYREASIRSILEQADRMQRLLDDLAEVVRLEEGQLTLRRSAVDLGELARREAIAAQTHSALHQIRVLAPDSPVVGEWDADRLGQVLQNLLANAIKYSPEGGAVEVTVEAAGDKARLAVRDEGPGIPAEHLPRLFGRFYRADATGAGGLGLGLYISRMIVEAHGGTIVVESAPGRGSTFSVTLPQAG